MSTVPHVNCITTYVCSTDLLRVLKSKSQFVWRAQMGTFTTTNVLGGHGRGIAEMVHSHGRPHPDLDGAQPWVVTRTIYARVRPRTPLCIAHRSTLQCGYTDIGSHRRLSLHPHLHRSTLHCGYIDIGSHRRLSLYPHLSSMKKRSPLRTPPSWA